MNKIYYPIAGMNYIIDDLSQLFRNKDVLSKKKIVLYISAQLNSFPHIGTLVNFMSAFGIAKLLKHKFGKQILIHLDLLENVSGEEKIIDGHKYFRSLTHIKDIRGISLSDKYFPFFQDILERLKVLDKIDYEIQFFNEYQKTSIVRETVIEIMNYRDEVGEILNPKNGEIYLRFPCPICGLIDKHNYKRVIDNITESTLEMSNICPIHGKHKIKISPDNDSLFDMNVPLRYITKAIYLIKRDKKDNTLSIIVDGGDWAGMWPLRIYFESLMCLGYHEVVNVVYTPTILDWSGSKLSKRIYVGNESYQEYLKEGLINYSKFFEEYGEIGFQRLYSLVNAWVLDPKKFLRDYTIEYLDSILRGNDNYINI